MKKSFILLFAVMMSISSYGINKDFAHTQFKKEAIELKVDIDQLKSKYDTITNDLFNYQKALNAIDVPYSCLVTNIIIVSSKYQATNIVKKTYTPYERKIKRILLSFNNKDMEEIYCRYYPEDNFKRLLAEMKEDFHELKNSHEEMMKARRNRRKSTSAKIEELTLKSNRLIKQRKDEINEEIRKLDRYITTSPNSIGYYAAKSNAERIMRKYDARDPHAAKNTLVARLNALSDMNVLDSRFQIAEAVRSEANMDVDEESEERFKQDKTACVLRHFDKISSNFIDMLEKAKADIAKEMHAKAQRASALTSMLNNWDVIDDQAIAQMNENSMSKILDAVNGVGFSEKVLRKKTENERMELEIAERKRELARQEQLDKDRDNERRIELEMKRRAFELALKQGEEDLETSRIRNAASRARLEAFSGIDSHVWDFSIDGIPIFNRDLDDFRQVCLQKGWICGKRIRQDADYAMSVRFPYDGIPLNAVTTEQLYVKIIEVKTNRFNRICGIRIHFTGHKNDVIGSLKLLFKPTHTNSLYVAVAGFFGYPFVDIVRKDLSK